MKAELYSPVIAATAALLGVAISQIFSLLHKAGDRKHAHQSLLRQKFEEMSMHVAESIDWLARMQNAESTQELLARSQSLEAKKALTLCQLYFLELVDPVNRYIYAQASCYQHVVECYFPVGEGRAGAVAFMQPGYRELVDELLQRKNELETLIMASAAFYSH